MGAKQDLKTTSRTLRADKQHEQAAQRLREAAGKDVSALYAMLDSSAEGLSSATAEKRLLKYGLNQVEYDRAPSWYVQLLKASSIPSSSSCWPLLRSPS